MSAAAAATKPLTEAEVADWAELITEALATAPRGARRCLLDDLGTHPARPSSQATGLGGAVTRCARTTQGGPTVTDQEVDQLVTQAIAPKPEQIRTK